MRGTLPAAAVKAGMTVMAPLPGGGTVEITISEVANATPVPGRITWWDEHSFDYEVGGSTDVEIVRLE